MSDDPLIRRLSQFTPDSAGLDRDALLFAGGRASARPNRRWVALSGALAASQIITLGLFLWAAPMQAPGPLDTRQISLSPHDVAWSRPLKPPTSLADASALWAVRERLLYEEGLPLEPASTEEMIPDEAPWPAFGVLPEKLLDLGR
jgi:hypothetical protein